MDEIWLSLCSMQITTLELAFVFAILANVGISSPAGHPQYNLHSFLSSNQQERFIRHAMKLLDDVEANDFELLPNTSLRCHLLLLIAYYLQGAGRYEEAWQTCKRAVTAAHNCRLFHLHEWQHVSPTEQYTVTVLQGEVPYLFNWMAYTMEIYDTIPFHDNLPLSVALPYEPEDPLDQAFMRQKATASTFARKAGRFIEQSKDYTTKELLFLAMQLDDEIMGYEKFQHPRLRDALQYFQISANDRSSVYLATYTFLTKGGLMLQRWRMAQTFYERHPLDIYQHMYLSSARTVLQMLPLVEQCFGSPWQTITARSWIDGFFNQALFIFLSAIKIQLFQETSTMASSGSQEHFQAIRGELVWFMSNFNQLYHSMSQLGMVRTALAQCATALKETPVQIRKWTVAIEEPIFEVALPRDVHDNDEHTTRSSSFSSSSSTSSSSSPSSLPSSKSLSTSPARRASLYRHHYEKMTRNFKEEYNCQSIFKSAFNTHNNVTLHTHKHGHINTTDLNDNLDKDHF